MVWTLVEPGVAIVASSLVTIRPLLRRIRLKGFESTEQSRSAPLTGRSRSRSGTGGLGSRTTRSATNRPRGYGGVPVGDGPDDVDLGELEKAYGGSHRGYCSAEETTVTSEARTVWGGAVGITLREADEEDDYISPVRSGGARSEVSTPNSDIRSVIKAATTTATTHKGLQTWQDETPQSPEESEHKQGLTCPSPHDGE